MQNSAHRVSTELKRSTYEAGFAQQAAIVYSDNLVKLFLFLATIFLIHVHVRCLSFRVNLHYSDLVEEQVPAVEEQVKE